MVQKKSCFDAAASNEKNGKRRISFNVSSNERTDMANFITGIRIIFSFMLLFTTLFSPTFYAVYIIAGISDVLDGIVARNFNLVSSLGEKLDTIADICFVGVTLYKLLPAMQILMWLWVWLGIIVFIKLANIMSGFMLQKTFVAKHTAANKITGIMLFLFPFSLPLLPLEYSATAVYSMATIAAIHEGIYMKTDKQ